MPRHINSRVFVSKVAIDRLLEPKAKASNNTLTCRRAAVLRLAEDCNRFFPWPALAASLMADAERLSIAISTRKETKL